MTTLLKNKNLSPESFRPYQDYIKENVSYDESSVSFLRARCGRMAGEEVGWVKGRNWYVSIKGKRFPVPSVVWFLCNGVWSDFLIRHRDGDKDNNNIDNLYEKPRANQKPSKFTLWDYREPTYPVTVEGCRFSDKYEISKTGIVISNGGKINHRAPIELSYSYDKDGYKRVRLQGEGFQKMYRVNRLVATHFIPNPEDYPVVNHLDKNKQNDCFDNLEWTDYYGNWKHSETDHEKQEIKVSKISKVSGETLEIYQSLMEAGRQNGINQGNITNCLKGRCKSVGGYFWKEEV